MRGLVHPDNVSNIARARSASPRSRERANVSSALRCWSPAVRSFGGPRSVKQFGRGVRVIHNRNHEEFRVTPCRAALGFLAQTEVAPDFGSCRLSTEGSTWLTWTARFSSKSMTRSKASTLASAERSGCRGIVTSLIETR